MNRLLFLIVILHTAMLSAQELDPEVAKPANIPIYVFVSGIVRSPGWIPYSADLTLMGAINAGGGFNDFADTNYVYLIRSGRALKCNIRKIRLDPKKDFRLMPWDIVHVPQYGDFTNPQNAAKPK